MTRPCSGCGLRSCSGDCFTESDPDSVELWNSLLKRSEQYRMTEVHSDPLISIEPKSRAA